MIIVDVLLPLPINRFFSYILSENLQLSIGDYITVPFGKRFLIGIVWQFNNCSTVENKKLKIINNKLELPTIRQELIQFIKWVSNYNLIPIGALLKMVISSAYNIKNTTHLEQKEFVDCKIDYNLTSEQKIAAESIVSKFGQYSVMLLDGETGSGKTEVYLFAIVELLKIKKDAQILILLPEIALTSQLIQRICSYFAHDQVIEWHSSLTPKTRAKNWINITYGNVKIVIGARSALFLPYKNLKLIIVDEEHESSFKQEQSIIYNARDMAVVLAKTEEIPIVLCSATPSLETMNNIQENNYEHLLLTKRFGKAELPAVKIIDMRTCKTLDKWISADLYESIKETLANHNQVMLFLNRRGYAQFMLCKACGHKFDCPYCSAWLVEHKKRNILLCHYCSYRLKIPQICVNCQDPSSLMSYGVGVEKLSEEVLKLIPNVKIATISSDITKKSVDNIINLILKGEVNIIIGTQMIAKGYNFPKLTLVGVIDADFGFDSINLKSAERTYQLLHQVSGRSGRFDQKGLVIMQTYNPESVIIKALQRYERNLFYKLELKSRHEACMPPFSKLIALIVTGKEQMKTLDAAKKVAQSIPQNSNLTVLGPTPSYINLLKGRYRYRILLKINNKKDLTVQQNLRHWIEGCKLQSNIRVIIDVDPTSFM